MSLVIIKTDRHYSDQWTAIDEATYDGPGSALGSGHTEEEAINELLEQLEDRGRDITKWKKKDATPRQGELPGL